jgi:signal transduction histidine kinase
MVQVFQNLIGNAIKYRREGVAPHIDVQARNSAQSWIVSVADNGMGIPAKYQERVFGIFQQLHRQSGGVGLGLAVAKRVIQQLGGSIWVESDGQNGSCFFLELPMSNQQNGVEAASADRAVTSRSSRG